jgi:AraC family transcriptional regulator, transcriptional activator of pobA
MSLAPIPNFYLYGEPHRTVDEGFVHVESLDDRSRPSEWTIQPHSHAELHHIFLIATGGGAMAIEDRLLHFCAPCLLHVPATLVHGFRWDRESSGSVITISTRHLDDLVRRDPDIGTLFRSPGTITLDDTAALRVQGYVEDLMLELSWAAPCHRAAVDSAILSIITIALRRSDAIERQLDRSQSTHARIVALFRERIEQRFRQREPVTSYAAALGISMSALRVACNKIAGIPPATMLDQRTLLEAKRALLYSNLSVAETGFSVGVSDPAYFSRYFTRHVGQSPRHYRSSKGRPLREEFKSS